MESAESGGVWSKATIVGECMVEMAPTDVSGEFRMGFAGDTFNTAWYLAALCPKAGLSYLTGVGRDSVSDNFVSFAAAAGVGTENVIRRDDRTLGLYMISLDNGERSFSYWRNASAARTLADDEELLDAAFAGSDLVYFSGITLGILDAPGRGRLLNALGRARAAGRTIAFDPNLRPKLWPGVDAMTAAVTEAAEVSDIVLPSFEDEQLYFGDTDTDATLGRYRALGAGTIIVKDGPNPVLYLNASRVDQVEIAGADRIVDTTAAGDSFNAGFFAALYQGKDIATAISDGAKLATHVIGARGALVPIPSTF